MTQGPPTHKRLQVIGLIVGPLLALALFLLLPTQYASAGGQAAFTVEGRATLAVLAWMATWWLTGATHESVTALLPLVLFPLLGVQTIEKAAAGYADPMIYLFMGGFVIALAMSRHGLDRRVALSVLAVVGNRPSMMVGGVLGVTAFLSMWVSNTATAALMLPIAVSVGTLAGAAPATTEDEPEKSPTKARNLGICLMLSIAYGASIGGLGTIIGSPPNGIIVGYLRKELNVQISFIQWMLMATPIMLVLLVTCWLLLTRVLFPVGDEPLTNAGAGIRQLRDRSGPMTAGEWVVLTVFVFAALFWMFSPLLISLSIPGVGRPLAGLTDTGIAMTAAVSLFLIPRRLSPLEFTLQWRDIAQLPWDVLILFGGGLALAGAIKATNVGDFLGAQAGAMSGLPPLLFIAFVVAAIVAFGETASNTATATTMIPIFAGMAPGLGLDPVHIAVCVGLAGCCGFILPVATPPNAIVMGSGLLRAAHMRRAGIWMDLVSVVLLTAAGYWYLPWALAHVTGR